MYDIGGCGKPGLDGGCGSEGDERGHDPWGSELDVASGKRCKLELWAFSNGPNPPCLAVILSIPCRVPLHCEEHSTEGGASCYPIIHCTVCSGGGGEDGIHRVYSFLYCKYLLGAVSIFVGFLFFGHISLHPLDPPLACSIL